MSTTPSTAAHKFATSAIGAAVKQHTHQTPLHQRIDDIVAATALAYDAAYVAKDREIAALKEQNAKMIKQLNTICCDETFPRTSLFDELTMKQLRAESAGNAEVLQEVARLWDDSTRGAPRWWTEWNLLLTRIRQAKRTGTP
jgi:hypothetical protein